MWRVQLSNCTLQFWSMGACTRHFSGLLLLPQFFVYFLLLMFNHSLKRHTCEAYVTLRIFVSPWFWFFQIDIGFIFTKCTVCMSLHVKKLQNCKSDSQSKIEIDLIFLKRYSKSLLVKMIYVKLQSLKVNPNGGLNPGYLCGLFSIPILWKKETPLFLGHQPYVKWNH